MIDYTKPWPCHEPRGMPNPPGVTTHWQDCDCRIVTHTWLSYYGEPRSRTRTIVCFECNIRAGWLGPDPEDARGLIEEYTPRPTPDFEFRDPVRDRKRHDPHAERAIYWLSPHERARRRPIDKQTQAAYSRVGSYGDGTPPGASTMPALAPGCRNNRRPSLDVYDGEPL